MANRRFLQGNGHHDRSFLQSIKVDSGALLNKVSQLRIIQGRRIKSLLYLVLGEAVFFFLIYLLLYGFSSGVSFDSERTYLANIDESPLALMVAWVPIYFVVGAILGQHMVFVRDVVLRASIWRCS